jgi:hypothetical protein
MTAPLQVLTTETSVSVRPMTVSLEELADAIKPWQEAQAEVDRLWQNRPGGSGPDTTEAENRALAAADDVLALLTTPLTPQQARDVSNILFAASLAVGHATKAVL